MRLLNDGWLTMNAQHTIRHDYQTAYGVNKMIERRRARTRKTDTAIEAKLQHAEDMLRQAIERTQETETEPEPETSEPSFDELLDGRENGPRHRGDKVHLTVSQRLFAWYAGHVM